MPDQSQASVLDLEYIPRPGMTGRIGPYEWTIVGDNRDSVLSRDGIKLLEARFILGGKYPWIVGIGGEDAKTADREELREKGICQADQHSTSVNYRFVIDMRNDHVEYIPRDSEAEIERITGQSAKSFRLEGFWGYFLSKNGQQRLSKLEAALKPAKK